jgi:rsbT co-antagonist protein RsbR
MDTRISVIRDRIIKAVAARSAEPLTLAGDDLDQALGGMDALERALEGMTAAPAEANKLQDLMDMVVALVSFDYEKKASISERHDVWDGMAAGLNMLGEELAASTVSKTYLNDIIESMSDLLVVTDRDARITTVNRATCALSRYSKEELVGQPLSMLFSDVPIDALIGSGGMDHQERLCRTKGGQAAPISFSASVLRNNNDEIQGLVCVAQDLTERKQLDEEHWRLREAVQRQSIILEELSTPLIPITREILVLPLVGSLDEQRATQMIEALLQEIVSHRARVAIIDITGVRVMGTTAVHGIVRAVQTVRMIGADVLLTGIRPEVALALVQIGADLSEVVTFGTLQRGIAHALKHGGRRGRVGHPGG